MMYHRVQVTCCILTAVVIAFNIGSGQAKSGECRCAAFDNEKGLNEPIIAIPLPASMIRVSCNDGGAVNCTQKCKDLGKNVPVPLASTFLCRKLNRNINIPQVHLFASICDTVKWMPAGFKILQSICCDAGNSVPCNVE